MKTVLYRLILRTFIQTFSFVGHMASKENIVLYISPSDCHSSNPNNDIWTEVAYHAVDLITNFVKALTKYLPKN